MLGVRIRAADAADLTALREIVQRAYEGYVERIRRRPAPMDDDYSEKINLRHVDVAAERGEVVGLIVLVPSDDHLFIENVAVDPAWQGRGIGRALMAHAELTAHRLGLPELRLYTNAAMTENLNFYTRLGYQEVARRTDHGFQRVFFSKPSAPR